MKTFWVSTGHDPPYVPSNDFSQISTYGKNSIEVLLNHYGKNKFALTLNDVETVKTAVKPSPPPPPQNRKRFVLYTKET